MASWDDDDFEPDVAIPKPKADQWEGEDEDEDSVKDNWDEDDASQNESTTEVKAAAPTKKKKSVLQAIKEKEEKKKLDKSKKYEERENEVERDFSDLTPEEQLAEKLRRQKLVEEADFENVKETFGVTNEPLPGQKTIESFHPTNKEEFNELCKMIVDKLRKYETNKEYVPFLENLFRDCCIGVDANDIKSISSSLNILSGEKLKASRAAAGKGKKKSLKKGLAGASSKASWKDEFDDLGGGYGNDLDDFDDFM